jgi:hypothetical protein
MAEGEMNDLSRRATIHFWSWSALSSLAMALESVKMRAHEVGLAAAYAVVEQVLDGVEREGAAASQPLPRPPLVQLKGQPRGTADVLVRGERVGPLVVFVDVHGLRYALPSRSVLALHDEDERQETTVMQITGGRHMRIQAPLDEVLTWFR